MKTPHKDEITDFLDAAQKETLRAIKKFPSPNPTIAALTEETGELAKAMLHIREGKSNDWQLVYDEAVQVAAVACRAALEGDSTIGTVPTSENYKQENNMTKFTHPKDATDGHKWQLRNGTPVHSVTALPMPEAEGLSWSLAVVTDDGSVYTYLSDGRYFENAESSTGYNLIDAPVERVLWLNIYHDTGAGMPKGTREEADAFADQDRTGRVKVIYTEGQFDE